MSDDFDPDAYLKKKEAQKAAPADDFDPDAYLAAKGVAAPAEEAAAPIRIGEPSTKEKVLSGALSFLGSGGKAIDELRGAHEASKPWSLSDWLSDRIGGAMPQVSAPSPLDIYRRVRDQTRRDVSQAQREHPVASVIGAVAPQLVGGGGTLLARLLASGATGAIDAAAGSNSDLTKGEGAQFAKDTGVGGALGLAAGAGGEVLGAGARGIARGAASRLGGVVSSQAAKDAAAVADEVASLRGQLGAESQKASRLFENTQRATGGSLPPGASAIDPALQQKAMLALSDPATARLQEKVLERSLQEIPGQTAKVTALEQALAQKSAGAGAEAAKRTSDYFAQPVFRTEIAPRLGRVATNIGLGSLAGGAAGIGEGLYKGGDFSKLPERTVTGAIGGLAGGSGFKTMVRNAAASPRVQAAALNGLRASGNAVGTAMSATARGVEPVARSRGLTDSEEASISAFLAGP